MAGNYPDAPSWRMAYDRDGTQVYSCAAGVATQRTSDSVVGMNDELGTTNGGVIIDGNLTSYMAFLFPEKRDLDGWYVSGASNVVGSYTGTVQVSTDTTNGIDGTWSSVGTFSFSWGNTNMSPGYRTVTSATSLGIRGVRFVPSSAGCQFNTVHLYGEITAGQVLDRLLLWHPTLDERVPPAYFDWGNVPRNSTATRDFRVKNMSPSKTANTVRVAMEALTDSTPSVPGQHALSKSGGTYLAQQTIASLAPGEISETLTLRRITPANAVLGVNAFRVFADAASWS